MRSLLLLLTLLAGAVIPSGAQTNSTVEGTDAPPAQASLPPAETNPPPAHTSALLAGKSDTEIFSDSFEFDSAANTATYLGNVRVNDPKMQLTCATLTVRLMPGSREIEHIVAEEKVVLDMVDEKGQKTHGTGDKAVFTYKVTDTATNDTVELMGNPKLETAQGTLVGDVITLDRANNKLKATNSKMLIRPIETNKTSQAVSPDVVPHEQSPTP